MNRRLLFRGKALIGALLLFVLLLAPACTGSEPESDGSEAQAPKGRTASDAEIERAARGEGVGAMGDGGESTSGEGGENPVGTTTVEQSVEAPSIHRASGENSRGDYTYLSDPATDGDPDAAVFATPVGSYDHNIGVWYEPERRRWAIFNQDLAPVPAGSAFEVVVPPESERFVHEAAGENVSDDSTYLDHPLVNGKPDAEVSATQNWNPGGGGLGVYNNHPVGVRYDEGRGRWVIYNGDRAQMPRGASFNVTVSEAARTTDEAATGGAAVADAETEEPPEYRNFYSEGDPQTPQSLVSSDSSAGAIPVVRPFNFGRDPGGPEDKTLYLSVPKLGIEGVPAFDTVSEEKLREGTVHIPATGYPWQRGANVFIAGHRLGYEGTASYYVFFRLDELAEGDEIRLQDSSGRDFVYRVTTKKVVGPEAVDVMNAQEGRSLVTLQTCTLPDYEDRLIVQGELVERRA